MFSNNLPSNLLFHEHFFRMSGRPKGFAQQIFVSKVNDKNPPESELLKRIKRDLKEVQKSD